LRQYTEGVFADPDRGPEQAQAPGPDQRNQPAVDRLRAGVRMAYCHGVIYEVHSQRCDGELTVYGRAHCWGRLMSLMPDAVTPPVEYLTELSLPYLRTAADPEYVQAAEAQLRYAMDAAAYCYWEAADKNARRAGAGAASRPVPPYERPDLSSWPKPDRVGRNLTPLLAERDRVAVNQARKEVDVRVRKGDDVPYLMTAGHHAKGLSGAGWRRVPEALDDLELPRGLHVAYPTVLLYYYNRMMEDNRSCLWDMYVVKRVQLTAIALLADLAGGRVHRISLALLHWLERLRLDDMAAGIAEEHARLQRLL